MASNLPSHVITPLYRGRCILSLYKAMQVAGCQGGTLPALFYNGLQNLPPWRVFFGFIPFPDTQRAAKKERPPKLQTPFRMVTSATGGLKIMRNYER